MTAMQYTMKDSGVPWIGEIPEHWKRNKIKYCTFFMPSCELSKLSEDTTVTFTPMECIKKGSFENRSTSLKNLNSSYTQYQNGDIVFAKVTPCFENGNIAIMEGLHAGFGFGSSELFVVRPYKVNTKFLFYSLQTNSFIDVGKASMTGTGGLKRVSSNAVMNYPIYLPPLPEQEAIAAYLDEKCGAIDEIISEAKATIEEYKAWKASVIFEAVTKGLDPNAEMKDSGVEWIGRVPKGWKVSRIKYHASFMPQCDFSQIKAESQITFTPMECIKKGTFENRSCRFGDINGSYTQYQDGDIVIAKVTPCFENGNCAIMHDLFSGVGLGSSELFVLRALTIKKEFLLYFLRMPGFIEMGRSTMTGTGGLKRVASDAVCNCPLPVPSNNEQERIVEHLDRQCSAIDAIIGEKQTLINDLEAYKKSLIFETVTGKRRVC